MGTVSGFGSIPQHSSQVEDSTHAEPPAPSSTPEAHAATEAELNQQIGDVIHDYQPAGSSPVSMSESDKKGGGMDKSYYLKDGSNQGFLAFKDNNVIGRELKAHESLKELVPDNLPQIDKDKRAPVGPNQEEMKGYWVQHVPHDKTFKPKMMAMMGPNRSLKDKIGGFTDAQKNELRNSLSNIKGKLPEISQHVGELSLAVHNESGKAYLLDYAANEAGEVGGEDLADQAGKGIDKILKLI